MADWTIVTFLYQNHKGREAIRTVRPIRVWFGCTAYHQEAQWLLEAWDLQKCATRDFAMSNILGPWTTASDIDVKEAIDASVR